MADAYVGTGAAFDMGLSFILSLKGESYRSAYTYNWDCILQLSATHVSPAIPYIAYLSTLWRVDAGVKWLFGSELNNEIGCPV